MSATDMKLRPHLLISVILGAASIAAFIGLAIRVIWFDVATVVALLALGILFLTQSDHNSNELRVTLHHTIGISLLVGVFVHVSATFISQWYKLFTVIAGIILLFCGALLIAS